MGRPGRVLAGFILAIGAGLLASCTPQSGTGGVVKGPACSQTNTSGMFSSQSFPAIDEGGGRVGLMWTGSGDVLTPDQIMGDYRLHDCRTGRQQGFDAYMLRETRYRGTPVTLEAFVTAIRAEGLMSRPAQLLKAAEKAGFSPVASHSPAAFPSERGACACALFYPGIPAPRAGKPDP